MKFFKAGVLATLVIGLVNVIASEPVQPLSFSSPVVQDELVESYEEPKNIMFASNLGGASHVTWVLSFLDELSKRGHNITYVASPSQAKFGKAYPHFNTIVLEGADVEVSHLVSKVDVDILEVIRNLLSTGNEQFQPNYIAYQNIINESNIDAVICDMGCSTGCHEAAMTANVPDLVTLPWAMIPDASAPYVNDNIMFADDPTTLRMSFLDRFNGMFIKTAKVIFGIRDIIKEAKATRAKAGCNTTAIDIGPNANKNSIKIVNSLFGMEAARPLGPLVELVGPIIPRKYDPLTPKLKAFLDEHERVVYIAFGQYATSLEKDNELLLTAILENVEAGVYDGFLWAARNGIANFPKTVTTKSGTTYNVQDMFDGLYPNQHFIRWAPQTAVVMHPSVSVFVTHGGAGSFYEGLFGGKRLAVYPFFGDQPFNALNVERNGLGVRLSRELSKEQVAKKLEDVGRDIDGSFRKNVKRYQALVQIHSNHGRTRAADLVEELIFVNKDGLLPYRYEDSRQMSYIKAHNLDLFAVALLIALIPLSFVFIALRCVYRCLFKKTQKQKTL